MSEKIKNTSDWLLEHIAARPKIAMILGSGLGNLGKEIQAEQIISYSDIPDFPVSTVEGHAGNLIAGKLGGKEILAMNGRFHYYEGYSMKDVTFPIRVFHAMGIDTLFVSNAAGGTNPEYHIGDLMVITDHINMLPENPLSGQNIPPGPRFLDMSHAYCPQLIEKAQKIAEKNDIKLYKGIYLATQGPTYETHAEYKMFKSLGADAVGMSTVPEVIVANHWGMKCFGISVITNIGKNGAVITHQEVELAADAAQPRMSLIFRKLIEEI